MIYVINTILCIVFIECFLLSRIVIEVNRILSITRESVQVITSSTLDDETKEKKIRQYSLQILISTVLFFIKFMLVLLAVYIIAELISQIFDLSSTELLESSLTSTMIITLTLTAIMYTSARHVIIKQLRNN